VERHDPHVLGDRRADQVPNALTHLVGGLVREGDGEDVARPDAGAQQMRYAVGDDARLARTGAGDDQDGSFRGHHRFALDRIEVR
jgi:hypothetical protein